MWIKLVAFGFRLLYNELAWTYDVVSWTVSLGEWRKWQYAALDFVQGKRVLEVAHGTGHLLPKLHEHDYAAVGLDLSAAMSRIARRRLARLGLAIPLLQGSAMQLPFESDSFDSIVTTFPTGFVVDEQAVAEFGRILTPTGRLVIVMGGSLRANGPLERLIDLAYAITGQTNSAPSTVDPYEAWRERFADNRFSLTPHTVQLSKSEAFLWVATLT